MELDWELLNFASAVRPLSSSVGPISSSKVLRAQLANFYHLVRQNALRLFPHHIENTPKPVKPFPPWDKSKSQSKKKSRQTYTDEYDEDEMYIQKVVFETNNIEDFPQMLDKLSSALRKFLKYVHDIPELMDGTDGELNFACTCFAQDLSYRVHNLQAFRGMSWQWNIPVGL